MVRRLIIALSVAALVSGGVWWLVSSEQSPLPDHWNPSRPLDIAAPRTPLTAMKLRRAAAMPEACLAALAPFAELEPLPALDEGNGCGIDPRLRLSSVGQTMLRPLETSCAIALRLAMWEHHTVQPAAAAQFGVAVTRLRHQSSYNCRPIRTTSGDGQRLSTHATAEAIDIAGVTLADGRQLELRGNWDGTSPEAQFFRTLRDGGCDWFVTVLGPEFNALHADHFHMQSVGWGTCR